MAKTSIVDEIEHHPQFCLDLSLCQAAGWWHINAVC
jgi:hypothetical protein